MSEQPLYKRYVPLFKGPSTETIRQDRLCDAISNGERLYWLISNGQLRRVELRSTYCEIAAQENMEWVPVGKDIRKIERQTIVQLDVDRSDGLKRYLEEGCVGEVLRLRVIEPSDPHIVWQVVRPGDVCELGLQPTWQEIRVDKGAPRASPPIRRRDVEQWLEGYLVAEHGDLGSIPLPDDGREWREKTKARDAWVELQPEATQRQARSHDPKERKRAIKPFLDAWGKVMRGIGPHRSRPRIRT